MPGSATATVGNGVHRARRVLEGGRSPGRSPAGGFAGLGLLLCTRGATSAAVGATACIAKATATPPSASTVSQTPQRAGSPDSGVASGSVVDGGSKGPLLGDRARGACST